MLIQALLVVLLSNVSESKVITLTDENSHLIFSGEWFIKAYAPWCGACKSIAKPWNDLGEWAEETDFNIAEIDITVGYQLSNQLLVSRIPTLYHVKDGGFTQYQGLRDVKAWKTFLLEGGSKSLEAMSWYRRPGSPTMTVFGYLISFALKINEMQNHLTDEFGIPTAVSVIILIIAPIILSITLFLFSVMIIHKLWGKPKPIHAIGKQRAKPRSASQCQSQDESEKEEITKDSTEKKSQ